MRWQASGSNRPLHEGEGGGRLVVALDHYTRGEGGGGRWQASGCVRPLHEGGGRGREVAG